MAVLGGILFPVGNITSQLGVVLVSFDRHHVVSRLGGGVLIMVGVGWLDRRNRAGWAGVSRPAGR